MSIRLDPRRLGTLKHLAGEAGVRPGDLVRQWVEERIDAERGGRGGISLADRVEALEARIAALEGGTTPAASDPRPNATETTEETNATTDEPTAEAGAAPSTEPEEPAPAKRARKASAAPSERVALHDEMIAILRGRGPMTAGELAAAITERGRYSPPRSGKPLDAAMVSQRVSNPTYRARFTRSDGRIGLADS